jgi:hypothetical protein
VSAGNSAQTGFMGVIAWAVMGSEWLNGGGRVRGAAVAGWLFGVSVEVSEGEYGFRVMAAGFPKASSSSSLEAAGAAAAAAAAAVLEALTAAPPTADFFPLPFAFPFAFPLPFGFGFGFLPLGSFNCVDATDRDVSAQGRTLRCADSSTGENCFRQQFLTRAWVRSIGHGVGVVPVRPHAVVLAAA